MVCEGRWSRASQMPASSRSCADTWDAGVVFVGYFLGDREAARVRLFADQVHPSVSYRLGEDGFESGFVCCTFGRLRPVGHRLPAVVDCDNEESHR